MPARTRNAGFVFQQYALFKHMTVADNIAFGLRVRPRHTRPSKAAITDRVKQLLDLVQLPGLEARYPSQLSAASANAWLWRARLPSNRACCCWTSLSGALDAKVRKELRADLRRIHDHAGVTTVFVTPRPGRSFCGGRSGGGDEGRPYRAVWRPPPMCGAIPRPAFVSEFLTA